MVENAIEVEKSDDDDGSTKSKTSFINIDVVMFSFSKIILLVMHLLQQKKKWFRSKGMKVMQWSSHTTENL